ncbi:MAG: [Clostridia bacterium]|nr:[FeFe] hydrogenase H-cluster radical SAM maturase HydE [Clostridia bacterium]
MADLFEQNAFALADELIAGRALSKEEFTVLIRAERELSEEKSSELRKKLSERALELKNMHYGNAVYIRGLIEISNYCKNNCLYCGIRRSNPTTERYRLSKDDILSCCKDGYALGFRTFVMQGGEDPYFTPELIARIVREIKQNYPDCAVTLSLGEHTREVYAFWREAGADRYLLRHETANEEHYNKLHPAEMKFKARMECLKNLRELGYQVGCGMMIGAPFQTYETLADDLVFIRDFRPHMVGIGPFIPAHDTPFANEKAGTLDQTLFILSIVRILLPEALLPSTTALGTIHPRGRELGVLAGGNVCMPNLSPVAVRSKYALYDNKICTGDEAAQCKNCLAGRMRSIGHEVVTARGDSKLTEQK